MTSRPRGSIDDLRSATAGAARMMAHLGLVTAFGHVSVRSGSDVLVTPPADLVAVEDADLVVVAVETTELPPGAPPETWVHLATYRRRPDVAAVARAQPESAFAVGAAATELIPLHGQGAWLGRRVPVHPSALLLRSPALAAAAAASLADNDAVVLRGNGAVTTGATPAEAVTRMWLLEATCRIWLAAHGAGDPIVLDDAEIAAWRAAAPGLMDRLWDHLCGTVGPSSAVLDHGGTVAPEDRRPILSPQSAGVSGERHR